LDTIQIYRGSILDRWLVRIHKSTPERPIRPDANVLHVVVKRRS